MNIKKIEFLTSNNNKIIYYIGKNQVANDYILNEAEKDDIWFHAGDDFSSCHVIACIQNIFNDIEYKEIINYGANLCKNNTNKLITIKNIPIIYTEIKNIQKTKVKGCVIPNYTRKIIV